jgi:integrase
MTFFEFCFREGLIEVNPVNGTDKAHEVERTRVLTDAELAELWQSLGVSGNGDFSDIVRLLLLTGQRREEIGGLRWSEVDLEQGVISLPPDRTKNRRPHKVPLSAPARAILDRRSRGNGDYVFGTQGFCAWSNPKAALDYRLGAKVEPWTLHDLRRTCATGMAELGVSPHTDFYRITSSTTKPTSLAPPPALPTLADHCLRASSQRSRWSRWMVPP